MASVAEAAAVIAAKTAPALAALRLRSKRSHLPLHLCNRRSLRRHRRQLRRATTMTAAVAAEAVGVIGEKTDLPPGGLRPHSRRSPRLHHPSNRHSLRPRSVTTPIAESVVGAANVIAVGLRRSSKHSLRRHRRCNRRSRRPLRRCRSPSCQCNRRNLRLRPPCSHPCNKLSPRHRYLCNRPCNRRSLRRHRLLRPRKATTKTAAAAAGATAIAVPATRVRADRRRSSKLNRRRHRPCSHRRHAPPPAAGAPPPQAPGRDRQQFGGGPGNIDAIKRGRRQRVEEGGKRTIIEEPGNRTIVQEKGGRAMIRHDEGERLRRTSRDVRTERRPDGGNLTIAIRPGGIEVFSEFDSSGRLQRRYRRGRDGRETNLIDNRRFRGRGPVIVDLRPPVLRMPRERYIVDYDRASDADIYDALMDGPIERLDRGYSLEEIRYNTYLRDRMRRIDLDTVNFDFGAWQVPYDQYRRLERIANAINRVLDRRPDEIFLIEGHTDAVGSDIDNLTLSDRRAEEVAIILTETFRVPPENLVTQGYGEEFLKIRTLRPERVNRRVAVRRITPLMARGR